MTSTGGYLLNFFPDRHKIGVRMTLKKDNLKIIRHGLTNREIAKILGCTHQNVSLIVKKALQKLRPLMEKDGLREYLKP